MFVELEPQMKQQGATGLAEGQATQLIEDDQIHAR